MAVWVAGAMVVSTVASVVMGNKSASAAARAGDQQTVAAANNLAFQQQQYNDWQAVYGPVQKQLSSFYQNLSGDSLIASGLKQYDQQFQQNQQNIQRSFAQRGIDSAAQTQITAQGGIARAEFGANLRNSAPMVAAQAKQSFVTSNVTNPNGTNVGNAMNNQANLFGQQQQRALGQQTQANTVLASNISGLASTLAQASPSQPSQPAANPNTAAGVPQGLGSSFNPSLNVIK